MKNLSEINIAEMLLKEALEHPQIINRISVYCEKRKEYEIVSKVAEIAKNKHQELSDKLQDAFATSRYRLEMLHNAEMKRFKKESNLEEVENEIKEWKAKHNLAATESNNLSRLENIAAMENNHCQDLFHESNNYMQRAYHDIFDNSIDED